MTPKDRPQAAKDTSPSEADMARLILGLPEEMPESGLAHRNCGVRDGEFLRRWRKHINDKSKQKG